jgi:uncharacterized protein YjbI with pentapeptide repeats/predicted amidohydrolase
MLACQDPPVPERLYTRVAVVQIAAHPAIVSAGGRSPLEDPLYGDGAADTLVIDGKVPEALEKRLVALRARVKQSYLAHLRTKITAVLSQCKAWGVRVVVFPEYAIPAELLDDVAQASADLVVVAGTHSVDRDARKAGVYEKLRAAEAPALESAVCPVIHRGRLLALQPKLHPAAAEGAMKPGTTWNPIDLPDGIPGPMGILVCLDFLNRESTEHRALVGDHLARCRFLAVPSWTPTHTLSEFSAKGSEEARRYGRPVLYADTAGLAKGEGGGTTAFVDEGRPSDLRGFPDSVGVLEPGEEGVVVADIDLGFERTGRSRRYDSAPPVKPFAVASLVDRRHPAGATYAEWLDYMRETLAREDDSAVDELSERVAAAKEILVNAADIGQGARERRLRRLVRDHSRFGVAWFRLCLREVTLPEDALPLRDTRAAMAAGAADAIFAWRADDRDLRLAELGDRLEKGRRAHGVMEASEWTDAARLAFARVHAAVLREDGPPTLIGLDAGERAARVKALVDSFNGAKTMIADRRRLKLRDVGDAFVEPLVRVGDEESTRPAVAALDGWLRSGVQTALLLGEFGSGKSALLAEWCARLVSRDVSSGTPLPILVDLATASVDADATTMLLAAASLPDEPRNRDALRLLVSEGHVLPCFDGFDEMAGRVGGVGLMERLCGLACIAARGGKILIASRDHYFANEKELRSTTAKALSNALGAASEHVRITVQPFDPVRVAELVRDVVGETGVDAALRKIANAYDLGDLVTRPLLLCLVLQSLDRIDPRARFAPADVYEACVQRWLEHTAEDGVSMPRDQKIILAEALAEQLWRSGSASCSLEELRASVRSRTGRFALPDHLPATQAFLDVQGGAFFVRDGSDRFRFAHQSFLEYFLARSLAFTMVERPFASLATKRLTPEVTSFVGEVLRRRGDPKQSAAVQAVRDWLAGNSDATGDPPAETREASANAVRLLHGLRRGAGAHDGWGLGKPDLRGIALVSENLLGVDLAGARLRGANFHQANLTNANLAEADLSLVLLSHAHLINANLTGANLTNAVLVGADLSRANLMGASLQGANLTGARLLGASIGAADFSRANLTDAYLQGTDLTGADLTGVNFANAFLRSANLAGKDFTGIVLTGANLTLADLTDANLTRAVHLKDACLKAVNLSHANLVDADLAGVDLSDANLTGADLSGADLTKAILITANLKDAILTNAKLSDTTLSVVRLTNANLTRADLARANLPHGDLSGANLSGANLTGADLSGASLTNANLTRADLSGANLSNAVLTGANLTDTVLTGAIVAGIEGMERPVLVELSFAKNEAYPIVAGVIASGLIGSDSASDGRTVPAAPQSIERTTRRAVTKHEGDALEESLIPPTPSPFRPGPALTDVDALAGREPALSELLSLVQSRSPAILVGPRRSGKTSLLRLLERRLAAHRPVHYVTLEGTSVRSAHDLARLLSLAVPSPNRTRGIVKKRGQSGLAFRRLFAGDPPPVFLIDEVAHLYRADETLFPWLRSLGQEFAGLVLAGSPLDWVNVVRRAATVAPGSSFGNDLSPVVLGPIGDAAAVRFLVDTSGNAIPPEVAHNVVELTGPWPFYLQVMGHALLEADRSDRRRPFLERSALRELYEKRLLFERTAVFEGRWRELPARTRAVLRAHADARPRLSDLDPADRTRVIDAGLCDAVGAWLPDRPFFDWILANLAILDDGSSPT